MRDPGGGDVSLSRSLMAGLAPGGDPGVPAVLSDLAAGHMDGASTQPAWKLEPYATHLSHKQAESQKAWEKFSF
jgi:hypothetical protein